MKTKSKVLLTALCAVLLVAASVMGTLAYLASTDTVKNTFTVGDVKIGLDEAAVNKDGSLIEGAARVEENEYHLLPGHTYNKDPMVTVEAGSEECYVRMMVTVTYDADADAILGKYNYRSWFNFDDSIWLPELDVVTKKDEAAGTVTRTYEFRYKTTVDASAQTEDVPLEALFTTITVPGAVTNEELATLNNLKIDVVAHAIQADGFETAELAWAAFEGKQFVGGAPENYHNLDTSAAPETPETPDTPDAPADGE